MTVFGNNFAPVEGFDYLEDGKEYRVRIQNSEVKQYPNSGNEYCKITVEVSGHKNASPNSFTLNAIPNVGEQKNDGSTVTQQDQQVQQRIHTAFFDAFALQRGDYNIQHWIGKIGVVKCKKGKNDYMNLVPVVKKEDKAGAQQQNTAPQTQAQPQQKTAPVMTPKYNPETQGTAVNGEFAEDIPF